LNAFLFARVAQLNNCNGYEKMIL